MVAILSFRCQIDRTHQIESTASSLVRPLELRKRGKQLPNEHVTIRVGNIHS
jgi:hypothetical protein